MNVKLVILIVFLAVTNLTCFFLMRHDKKCAEKGKWRVPEKTLFLSAALFGALGGVIAMRVFRHKTQHPKFKILFPLMLVIQIVIVGFVVWKWILEKQKDWNSRKKFQTPCNEIHPKPSNL